MGFYRKSMLNPHIAEQEIIRRFNKAKVNLKRFNRNGYSGNHISLFFLYQNILGRSPSSTELIPFTKRLEIHPSPKKLTKLILYSCESLLRNSSPPKSIYFSAVSILLTPKTYFINNIFLQVLGRKANDFELQIWNKRLKYTNRILVFLLFLRVAEYRKNYKFFALSETSLNLYYKIKSYIISVKYFIKGNPILFNKNFRKQPAK